MTPTPWTIRLAAPIAALTLVAGCGKKPEPRADTSASARRTPSTPPSPLPAQAPPTVQRTLGGVDLTGLTEPGPEGEAVVEAALLLVEDKPKAIEALIRSGPAARRVVVALLASKSLDEVTGALEVLGVDGDPTTSRPAAADAVVDLLLHNAAAVRDRAWQVAPLVLEGEALIELVRRVAPDRKRTVVRLLELWDSPAIRALLIELARDEDPDLAREAGFTLTTPSRPLAAEVVELVSELLSRPQDRPLGLTLARRLPEASLKPLRGPLGKAIDEALLSSELPLKLAALRATVLLSLDERLPLLEQLARDAREDVRRVAAEALGHLGPADAPSPSDLERLAAALDGLLGDGEGAVRIAAIRSRAALVTATSDAALRSRLAASATTSLAAKLQDGHRGVRLAAAVVLAQEPFTEAASRLLVAQLGREDQPGQAIILEALAASKHRPLVELVLERLDDPGLSATAYQALHHASGQDFAADSASWRPWFEETYPQAPPE